MQTDKTKIMKSRQLIICLTACLFLLSSCDGLLPRRAGTAENDNQELEDESSTQYPEITFKVVTAKTALDVSESYKGLLLLADGEYVEFDDEKDYYDLASFAIVSYLIAKEMYDNGYSRQKIEHYLPQVFNLPIEDEIADVSVKEIFNRVFYDNRDKDVYTSERKYGYCEFPYGEAHEDWMTEWVAEEMFGAYGAGYGRNSIIIERASREDYLNDCNGIPPTALFIKDGWFI